MPSAILQPVPWPDTLEAWVQLLNIQGGADVRCHGKKKVGKGKLDTALSNDPCRNKVSKKNWADVQTLLRQIADAGASTSYKDYLTEVAQLLVCRNLHQYQGPGLLAQWLDLLVGVEDRSDSDENLDSLSLSKDDPDVNVKPTRAVLESIPEVPKQSLTTHKKAYDAHTFEPFRQRTSTKAINEAIKELVLKPLSTTDLKERRFGKVYIYTFPNLYRTRSPFLKIGNAKDVEARMKQWKSQCGYEPKVLSSFTADFYVRVERLVHEQLRNERLRERQCPGCGKTHLEWFQAKTANASKLAGLWTDWTRQQPYDDNGTLEDSWAKRVVKVDLDNPNCWEDFVNYVDEEDIVNEEEEEEEEKEEEGEEAVDAGERYGFMDHDGTNTI